jgi:hypothetical protein
VLVLRLLGLLVVLLATTPLESASAKPPTPPPTPLVERPPVADPSVVVAPSGLVAVSTGLNTPRVSAPGPAGPWTRTPAALGSLPSWATGSEIWAAELHQVGDRWLLYFAAPVRGLGPEGRCIGVAQSDAALGTFHPVEDRPLVCPTRARALRGYDRGNNRSGVIDPSVFVDRDGRMWLSYKTQGLPSSLRVVRLDRSGRRTAGHADGRPAPSAELLRAEHTIENPVLVRQGRRYVLFYSRGNFRTCRYRTLSRRADSLAELRQAKTKRLLTRSTTGVCGPGGADVVRRGGMTEIYFHGWVCGALGEAPFPPCPADLNSERDVHLEPRRVLYGARLGWTSAGRPRVAGYYAPAG